MRIAGLLFLAAPGYVTRTHTHIRIHKHTYAHRHTQMYTHTYTHTQIYRDVHTYIQKPVHTRGNRHFHTHTHTHTRPVIVLRLFARSRVSQKRAARDGSSAASEAPPPSLRAEIYFGCPYFGVIFSAFNLANLNYGRDLRGPTPAALM